MSDPATQLIDVVRRRMIRLRRVHRIEAALLTASIAAAIFTVILLFLQFPPFPAAAVIVGVALIGGGIWAAAVRVPSLAAATLIDERCDLQDLLATVMATRSLPVADLAWQQALRSRAERRCREINPDDIQIGMTDKHMWAAILVVLAMTFTLALWTNHPVELSSASFPADQTISPSTILDQSPAISIDRPRPPGHDNLDEPSNRSGPVDSTAPDAATISAEGRGAPTGSTDKSSGSSTGLGRTSAQIPRIADSTSVVTDSSATTNGRPGGGGAAGGANGLNPTVNPSLQSPHAPSTLSIPPWQSPTWPAAQSAANQAIQSNAVDPAYRDLIRDYFNRP
jgi:hypothetical protein